MQLEPAERIAIITIASEREIQNIQAVQGGYSYRLRRLVGFDPEVGSEKQPHYLEYLRRRLRLDDALSPESVEAITENVRRPFVVIIRQLMRGIAADSNLLLGQLISLTTKQTNSPNLLLQEILTSTDPENTDEYRSIMSSIVGRKLELARQTASENAQKLQHANQGNLKEFNLLWEQYKSACLVLGEEPDVALQGGRNSIAKLEIEKLLNTTALRWPASFDPVTQQRSRWRDSYSTADPSVVPGVYSQQEVIAYICVDYEHILEALKWLSTPDLASPFDIPNELLQRVLAFRNGLLEFSKQHTEDGAFPLAFSTIEIKNVDRVLMHCKVTGANL